MKKTLRWLGLRARRAGREFHFSTVLVSAGAGLGFLTIATGVWSIEHANWISPQPSLITTLALSLATAFVLAYVPLKWIFRTLFMIAGGLAVAGWQATQLYQPETDASRFYQFWQNFTGARPSEASIYFVLFLVLITWLIGYFSTWFVLRKRNAWPAVVLGATMLLANLSNLPRDSYYYFPLFALCAVALLAVTHLAAKGDGVIRWKDRSVRKGMAYFITSVLVISIIVSGVSYGVPEPPLDKMGVKLDTSTVNGKDLSVLWFNIFAAVRSKWTTMKSKEQEKLLFKNPLESGSQVHFVISAGKSDYWRTRRYDVYQPWGWSSTVDTGVPQPAGTILDTGAAASASQTITYTVQNLLKTDVTLADGEIAIIDIPVKVQTFAQVSGIEEIATSSGSIPGASAPFIMSSTEGAIAVTGGVYQGSGGMYIATARPDGTIQTVGLAPGTQITVSSPGTSPTPIAASKPPDQTSAGSTATPTSGAPDVAAVISSKLLRPYDRYQVTATATTATPQQLTAAGTSYPESVTSRYLQLPATFPYRIRQQTLAVTRNAKMPYDKAVAIKAYLQGFQYDLSAPAPAENVDGVSYFLFTSRRGVCTNFASAMAVMLRSAGVPTRLASGYLRGELDANTGQWVIRGRNYHAWVEVYFPTYGWVPFEATPATATAAADVPPEEGYNYSFTNPDELPPWMIEDMGPGSMAGAPGSSLPAPHTLPWPYIYLITIGSVLLVAVFTAREVMDRWVRSLQRAAGPADTYARMCHLAARGKTGPFLHETPTEFGRRLVKYLPAQDEAIGTVAVAYTATTYSLHRVMDGDEKVRMQKAWVELAPALVRHMMRLRQWSVMRIFWKP